MSAWKHTERNRHRESIYYDFMRFGVSSTVRNPLNSEFMGKTFQAAQLTHERYLIIDT